MANKLASENKVAASGAEPGDRVITRADNNPPTLLALLLDEITEANKAEWEKVEPIRARANALDQKIETDEQLAAWTGIYNEADRLWKSLDEARKNANRPILAGINEAFGTRQAPLERITTWIRDKADAFNRDKVKKQRAKEAAERERLAALEREKRREAEILAQLGDGQDAQESLAQAIEAKEQLEQAAPTKTADVARVQAEGGGKATAAGVWKHAIDDYSKVDLNALRLHFKPEWIDRAVAAIVKTQKGATRIEGVRVFEDVQTSFRK